MSRNRWTTDATSQIHYPKTVNLAQIASAGAPPAGTLPVYFRVPIVDARLRVKISVIFVAATQLFEQDITGYATLWIYESDDVSDNQGGGRTSPLTNLDSSTEAAPLAVPATPPLLGYSREFQSAADYIEGKFTLVNVGTIALGSWILVTRYQPAPGQRFTPDEWEKITPLAQPELFYNKRISY